MIKLLKQLFCKHHYQIFWKIGDNKLYLSKPYYDAWAIKKCLKCKKEIDINQYEIIHNPIQQSKS